MSIRFKLPLLVLAAFLINILLLYGYYNFYLSREIAGYNSSMREQLQTETDRIIKKIESSQDFSQALQIISQTENLNIQVVDESGRKVFHGGKDGGVSIEINSSGIFHHDNKVYLLKVTQPVSLKKISSYYVVWNLFIAEIFIICFILLFIAAIFYFNYVKPIIALQKSMERYKEGIHPQNVARKDEIGLLQNQFVRLTEAIEKEKQKQDLIIASISHDIKTPLTSVMGYAERLKKNNLTADRYGRYIDIIYNKSVSIRDLIEEFDEYLNLQMQSGLKQQRISAEKFCAILKSDYEEELAERGVSFSISVNCPDEILFIDIAKMRRVFGNIIGNSLKHFSIREPSIKVFCSKQENYIIFSIEDNGTGVSEEELQKMFDPFYTSDKSRSVAGLGLSICREIVEACNGTIWAENNETGGLCVKISLPHGVS